MNRSFLKLITVIALALPTTAQAQVRLDVTTGVRNQYVLGMAGVNVHDEPVIQGDLWWTLPHGFWFDTWYDTAVDLQPGFNREVDWGAGWMGSDLWGTGLSLKAGAYYYDLYHQFSLEEFGDIVETFTEVSYNWPISKTETFKPYVKLNYFWATQMPGQNNGTLSNSGVQYKTTTLDPITLQGDLSATYDSGVFGANHGIIGRASIVATAQLADWIALSAPLKFTTPLSESLQDREFEATYGLDVIFSHTFVEPPPDD